MDVPAQYPIDTIAQMAAIPAEARGRFLAELPAMLDSVKSTLAIQAAVNAALGAEVMMSGGMMWIDDDKGQHTVSVRQGDVELLSITTTFRPQDKSYTA